MRLVFTCGNGQVKGQVKAAYLRIYPLFAHDAK